jgi:1-deoxy-D-xylulose-5-phosphate synthase
VEENIQQGGLGSAVLELFSDAGLREVTVKRLGLPDSFVEHGPVEVLREKLGLDKTGIIKAARGLLTVG